MARGMNHVYLQGALARDPELRYTSGGQEMAILDVTVAGEDVIIRDEREIRLPWYHRLSIIGKQAEYLSERNMKQGDGVFVEGTLEYRSWEDPESGEKRSAVRVRPSRVDQLRDPVDTVSDAGGGMRMSGGTNDVMVIGNLTRDPEIRAVNNGDNVAVVGIAVNESYRDRENNMVERTHYLEINMWRELAEVARELHKGDPIQIKGRLVNTSWEDEGKKRTATRIEVTEVTPLKRGNTESGAGADSAKLSASPEDKKATRQAAEKGKAKGRSTSKEIEKDLDDMPEEEDLPF